MLFRSFSFINHHLFLQNGNNVLGIYIQIAGLRHFPIPTKIQFEYPPNHTGRKLPILPKIPIHNTNIKPSKMQKRLKLMRGPELVLNKLIYKQYGIIALSGGRMKFGHFEMLRWTCNKRLPKNASAVLQVDGPWQPVTKKTHGMRMGGGKGDISSYVTPIKAGRVILEIIGPFPYKQIKQAVEEMSNKLPFKAIAITQSKLDQMQENKKYVEENNENPWTMKYIIQNNLGGCHRWIKPIDKYWFGKYT